MAKSVLTAPSERSANGRSEKNKEKSGTEYYNFSETAKENSVYFGSPAKACGYA